jgi:hypothetical protein
MGWDRGVVTVHAAVGGTSLLAITCRLASQPCSSHNLFPYFLPSPTDHACPWHHLKNRFFFFFFTNKISPSLEAYCVHACMQLISCLIHYTASCPPNKDQIHRLNNCSGVAIDGPDVPSSDRTGFVHGIDIDRWRDATFNIIIV